MSGFAPVAEADIDRVRELVSIGAGHAATALAGLTGRTCEMQVPTVRWLADAQAAPAPASDSDVTGVLFELEGGTGGVLALLLPGATRERILEHLLGPGRKGERGGSAAESALREVGNILASHAANAVGEMLGEAVLPSVPLLALEDGPAALASLLALRHHGEPALRIEAEICDRARELRGTLVLVPDTIRRVAPVAGF
jgi:chemotaxis protein CheC